MKFLLTLVLCYLQTHIFRLCGAPIGCVGDVSGGGFSCIIDTLKHMHGKVGLSGTHQLLMYGGEVGIQGKSVSIKQY
jgi:hypothetical protein